MNALLGVPSWVIPGTYGENLRFLDLKREIQTVELLFFIYDEEVRGLLEREYELIRSYGSRFTFTAHLPDPLLPKHEELVERLAPWVRHFVVHPGPLETIDRTISLLDSWEEKFRMIKGTTIQGIKTGDSNIEQPPDTFRNPAPAGRFLLENTQNGLLEALLQRRAHSPICMDTGHLLLSGISPLDFYHRHGERIGEIHLHGVDHQAAREDALLPDHRGIDGTEGWFLELQGVLKEFPGVINVEVFSWGEAERTLRALKG